MPCLITKLDNKDNEEIKSTDFKNKFLNILVGVCIKKIRLYILAFPYLQSVLVRKEGLNIPNTSTNHANFCFQCGS